MPLQLRGIDKKIAALKAELNYATTVDRQQYVSGIMCLEEEKSKLACGVIFASGGHAGEGDDSDAVPNESARRSPSTEEEAQTPPPSAKLCAMDSDDEESDIPSLTRNAAGMPSSALEGSQGSAVICERELRQHFHLPLHSAAQKFGICTTAFKKMCRRFGIAKWPHR